MFEQTFLAEPKTARKPYSIFLSLILQIAVIGIFCLLPFVFTQVLPTLQLKSVLAAPPKPPIVLKAVPSAARTVMVTTRPLRMSDFVLRTKQPLISHSADMAVPTPIIGAIESGGDSGSIPFSDGISNPLAVPPPLPVKMQAQAQKPIRVGSIAAANLIHKIQPVYPPMARSARVQGVVEFTATISKNGAIENLMLVRGHPLLVSAAREAVLQWRYRPTMLNGEPVEVITDIVVNFTLNQ